MKIEISEVEIKTAIIEYVATQGLTMDTAKTTVDLRAGRGENGMTATINIGETTGTPIVDPELAELEATVDGNTGEPEDVTKLKFG